LVAVHQGDASGPVVATTRSDAKGYFKVNLAPGWYTVTIVNKGGGVSIPARVKVVEGRYAKAKPGLSVK
jgi:hypothetical protein